MPPFSAVPRLCCYFVFSIDSVTTLASLGDCEATRAAKRMAKKKYIAYAHRAVSFLDPEAEFQSYEIRIVKRGMPLKDAENSIEPDMCTPILPATEHPMDRSPLSPSKPLPFSDCYHPSFGCNTTVRVRKRYKEFASAAELSVDEMIRHEELLFADNSRRLDLRKTYNASHPKPPPPVEDDQRSAYFAGTNDSHDDLDEVAIDPSPSSPSEVTQATTNPASVHDNFHLDASPGDPESDPENDINNVFAAIIEMTRPPDTMVVAKVSYDLWSVKNIGDPEDFFKEKAYLEQLEKESKLRAIERARKIDEKAFSKNGKVLSTKSLPGRVAQQFNKTLTRFTSSARLIVRRVGKGGNST